MIETKKTEIPWHDKFRKVETFKDSKDFVDGYNQALKDFDLIFGLAKLPDVDYREGTIHGSNQIHNVCKFWELEYKTK